MCQAQRLRRRSELRRLLREGKALALPLLPLRMKLSSLRRNNSRLNILEVAFEFN